jgi:hypothetical protein
MKFILLFQTNIHPNPTSTNTPPWPFQERNAPRRVRIQFELFTVQDTYSGYAGIFACERKERGRYPAFIVC